MPDLLVLFLAACGTALATGLGAIPVWFLGSRAAALTPFLLGIAAGVMGVASIVGLLLPAAEEGSVWDLLAGLVLGGVLLGVARARLDTESVFMGRSGPGARTSALVFAVLFVHSLPEGLAVGTAFASDRAGLGLFVILAIAIQNVPEGTSVAIPMEATGYGRGAPVLGGGRDQRAAAGRRRDRLPRGRTGQRPAAVLLRLRRRGDAEPDRDRAAAPGLRRSPPLARPDAGDRGGRGGDDALDLLLGV